MTKYFMNSFEVKGRVKIFPGPATWFYVEVPRRVTEILSDLGNAGYRFLPIDAKVGSTTWRTSLLPLKNGGKFIALKKEIRKKENIEVGDMVKVEFSPKI